MLSPFLIRRLFEMISFQIVEKESTKTTFWLFTRTFQLTVVAPRVLFKKITLRSWLVYHHPFHLISFGIIG